MLYRLNSNDIDYLHLVFDDEEVIEKLGEDNLIQIESDPVEYASIWKPITIKFEEAMGGKIAHPIPDLQFHCGHLFMSERAADVLSDLLRHHGELLPVHYDGKQGFIFNPLISVNANEKQSIKTPDGEVKSLFFDAEKLIFKTPFDDHYGVYCNDEFKNLVDENGLVGLVFERDLSYIFLRLSDSETTATN